MKNNFILPILSILFIFACSSKQEEVQKTLAEQQFEFEIYDSLVVDYLGNLYLADISKDGETFLLIDHQKDSIFVTDQKGKIVSRFCKKGDGPGNYKGTRNNLPQFFNSEEIIIPAWKGFYIYSKSGEFQNAFELDYLPTSSLINVYINNLAFMENQILFPWEGRIAEEFGVDGKKFQLQTKRLEILDLESGQFSPKLPFPKESKFKTGEKSYLNVNYKTIISQSSDTIYVVFRNEPRIYAYHKFMLDEPSKIYQIPFDEFVEKAPKDADYFGSYEMKDIYVGSLNQIQPLGNDQFLINYARGVTDLEYDQITTQAGGDNSKFFPELSKINSYGWVLFDSKSVSKLIENSPEIGNLGKFVSKEEIWFTPNYSEVEKDYVVIYKTRIVSK
jgi:hypothetical protein